MSALLDNLPLPKTQDFAAVRLYLEAQSAKDFARAPEFFDDDVDFVGLILEAKGRETVTAEMVKFITAAIEYIEIEAIAQVEDGPTSRFLAMYWFKLLPADKPQMLCDHITVRDGKITRIENCFDVTKLPPMPG